MDVSPFFDYLKSEYGHEVMQRALGIVDDVKKAALEEEQERSSRFQKRDVRERPERPFTPKKTEEAPVVVEEIKAREAVIEEKADLPQENNNAPDA